MGWNRKILQIRRLEWVRVEPDAGRYENDFWESCCAAINHVDESVFKWPVVKQVVHLTDADHVRNHVLKYLHILNSLEIEKDEDKSGQKNKELYVIEPPLQNICLAELIVPKKEYYNESRYQGQSQSYQRKYDQVSLFHTILLSLALEEGIIATNKQARVKFLMWKGKI